MKPPLKIAVCGSNGRMGRAIAELAGGDARFLLLGGISRSTPPKEAARLLREAEILVDFSRPAAALRFAPHAARAVIGTTGFSPAQLRRLRELSRRKALLVAPNTSPGMNVLAHLAGRAAAALKNFEAGVCETHHSKKKDAPSGSAKLLAEKVRAARPGPVPIASLRAGDVVGDHTLLLAGPGERLELTHRAHSRNVFARGALDAALWLAARRPGWYTMEDMLGLKR